MNKKSIITAFPTFLRPYRLQALRDYRRQPIAFLLVLVAMTLTLLTSCTIVRGYKADGAYGPTSFSYQKQQKDTVVNRSDTFTFHQAAQQSQIQQSPFFTHLHIVKAAIQTAALLLPQEFLYDIDLLKLLAGLISYCTGSLAG